MRDRSSVAAGSLSRLLLATLLATACLASACASAAASAGAVAERTMALGSDVDGVEFGGRGIVSIVVGDEPGVRLEAPSQALLDAYDVEQRGDTLIVERRDRRTLRDRLFGRDDEDSEKQSVVVEITLASVDRVEFGGAGQLHLAGIRGDRLDVTLAGAGECTLEDLKVEDLELTLSGAGDCTANGSADALRLRISGAGEFDGEALAARIVRVVLSGAADARFDVSEELDATVSGAGSIAYRGRPAVTQQITGFGSISRID